MSAVPAWLKRFLQPQFALAGAAAGAVTDANSDFGMAAEPDPEPNIVTATVTGRADTPATDAVCEIYLTVDATRIVVMRFAVYGPPVVVACADWLCEAASGRTIAAARGLSPQDLQQALALSAQQRYGALLALDALDNALSQLQI